MLQKRKKAEDKGKWFGALLTDLSKAFDCYSNDLLIVKLHACGFNLMALKPIQSYLSKRTERTKINLTYSCREEILFGVTQGSIISPLLCNIFLCELIRVISKTDFTSYAGENMYYISGDSI